MRDFRTIKRKKTEQLKRLQYEKSNWKDLSRSERHLLHNRISKLEDELHQLKQYQMIKNKFKIQ